jgi:hypothetical protein
MKKYVAFFIACAATTAFANPTQINTGGEAVELVSADKMPLTPPKGEVEKLQKGVDSKAQDGFSKVENAPEKVKGFQLHLNAAKSALATRAQASKKPQAEAQLLPEVYKDLSSLNLGFKAAVLNNSSLIVAAPVGTKVGKAWSGVERFLQVEGGVVRLTEYDLAATGGKFYMAKEMVNARVNGQSAISKIFVGDNGQTIEEIVWVTGHKFHMLTFSPDLAPGTQLKAASHVSALSLATQLR